MAKEFLSYLQENKNENEKTKNQEYEQISGNKRIFFLKKYE